MTSIVALKSILCFVQFFGLLVLVPAQPFTRETLYVGDIPECQGPILGDIFRPTTSSICPPCGESGCESRCRESTRRRCIDESIPEVQATMIELDFFTDSLCEHPVD